MKYERELLRVIERHNGQKGWYNLAHTHPFLNAPAANYLFDDLEASEAALFIENREGKYWITGAGRKRLAELTAAAPA